MKKIFLLLSLIIMFKSGYSQNITTLNLRDTLLNFLIYKDDLQKSNKPNDVLLIINDILTLKKFEHQEYGIFKFGTLASHSYFHIFLKNMNNFMIIDMNQPFEIIISKMIEYFKTSSHFSKEEIIDYISKTIDLYSKNQNVIPWKIEN